MLTMFIYAVVIESLYYKRIKDTKDTKNLLALAY